jgi:ribonucleoside-diphosphate reductase alpha chain
MQLFTLSYLGIVILPFRSEILVTFINMVESEKLRLIEKKQDSNYDVTDNDYYKKNILPSLQTDLLIEEIANLQLKHLSGGKISIEKVVNKFDKDRFSSLIYPLWYIKTFEENSEHDSDYDFVFTYS